MKIFNSLEQRMLNTYLESFPPFVSDKAFLQTAQQAFYDFMRGIYISLYENPQLLFGKLNEDDFYRDRFNKAADKKPKLYSVMQSDIKKIEDFLTFIFEIGKNGRVYGNDIVIDDILKINKSYLAILGKSGVAYSKQETRHVFSCGDGGLLTAWVWAANKPETSLLRFTRCMFMAGYPYPSDIFSALLGDKSAFEDLKKFLVNNGYTRTDNRTGAVALDFAKNYGKIDEPLKNAWAERNHAGVSFEYSFFAEKPAFFSIRIPKYKEILSKFDLMDNSLQEFVIRNTKKCNGCRYCVQTDKTALRPLAFMIAKTDKEYKLCPYFPGFTWVFTEISTVLVDNIIQFLLFINKTLQNQGGVSL